MPVHDWSRVDAGVFHHLHLGWIAGLSDALNRELLPPGYYALAEPVVGDAVPDVLAIEAAEGGSDQGGRSLVTEGTEGTAVASAPAAVVVQDLAPTQAYDLLRRRIVVRNELRGDRLVAVIEIASRANKDWAPRRDHFVQKLLEFLEAGIHVLLLDLVPATGVVPEGFHPWLCRARGTPPAALPADRPLQAGSYEVVEGSVVRAHVVPLRPGDALPEMPLFLLPYRFLRVPLERTYSEAFAGLPGRFQAVLEA